MSKINDLLPSAATIRDASTESENSALRVGGFLVSLVQALNQQLPGKVIDATDISVNAAENSVTVTFKTLEDGTASAKAVTLPVASTTTAGLMSKADKQSLLDVINTSIPALQQMIADGIPVVWTDGLTLKKNQVVSHNGVLYQVTADTVTTAPSSDSPGYRVLCGITLTGNSSVLNTDYDEVDMTDGYLGARNVGEAVTINSGSNLQYTEPIPVLVGDVCEMVSQGTGIAPISWGQTADGTFYAKAISSVTSGEQINRWEVDADGYVKFSSRKSVFKASIKRQTGIDLDGLVSVPNEIDKLSEEIDALSEDVTAVAQNIEPIKDILQQGILLEIQGNYTPESGQGYGTVGNTIQFEDNGYSHYRIPRTAKPIRAIFSVPSDSNPSSLIQYVDDNDIIIALAAKRGTYNAGAENQFDLIFPDGSTAVYISGWKRNRIIIYARKEEIKPYGIIGDINNLETPAKSTLVDALNSVNTADRPIRLRMLSWNIGHFAKGNSTSSAITESNYEQQKKAFRNLFNSVGADIVGLCEFSSIFYGTETAQQAILAQYKYPNVAPTQSWYIGTALFSSFPIKNLGEVSLGNGYKAYYGTATFGKDIKIVECHLPWQSQESNIAGLETLINYFADDEYVIIGGDFNFTNGQESTAIEMLEAAGYQNANWGYLGPILTSYNNVKASNCLDNIAVKGGSILHTEVIQNTPDGLDADAPQLSDEALWDEVNLSDHFPIICDINF